jgi:hypothetical protein
MQDFLAHKLEQLLRWVKLHEGLERMHQEQSEVERLLEEANMFPSPSDRDKLYQYSRSLLADNPYAIPLAEHAMKYNPELQGYDLPTDLVTSLLPSDHHLD